MTAKTFSVGELLGAADVNEYLAGGYWKRINRSTVSSGSPVSSVSFASLSSTYKIFRLTLSCVTSADDIHLRLNNDSGSNYTNQRHSSTATTGDSSQVTLTYMQLSSFGSPTLVTGQFFASKVVSNQRALIHGQSTVFTTDFSTQSLNNFGCNWNNTSALINRIDVIASSGTFYGVVALEAMASS